MLKHRGDNTFDLYDPVVTSERIGEIVLMSDGWAAYLTTATGRIQERRMGTYPDAEHAIRAIIEAQPKREYPSYKAVGGSTQRPYVIHPYFTGRDKGAVMDPDKNDGSPLLFMGPGEAWFYVFNTLQPNDERAKRNYRVITLDEYKAS